MSRRKFSNNLVTLRELSKTLEDQSRLTYVRYGTEHMLISMAELPKSRAAALLAEEGFSSERALLELEAVKGKLNPNKTHASDIVWGPTAYELLRAAEALAGRHSSDCVDDMHLLLAIVQTPKCGAYQLLKRLKINYQKIETTLVKKLSEKAE
jgi:ATP-dependent Clp protease ATP-binding subunit ClpA